MCAVSEIDKVTQKAGQVRWNRMGGSRLSSRRRWLALRAVVHCAILLPAAGQSDMAAACKTWTLPRSGTSLPPQTRAEPARSRPSPKSLKNIHVMTHKAL